MSELKRFALNTPRLPELTGWIAGGAHPDRTFGRLLRATVAPRYGLWSENAAGAFDTTEAVAVASPLDATGSNAGSKTQMGGAMQRFLRDYGLSVALAAIFLVTWV